MIGNLGIVPIFKSGQKCEVQIYRPASLKSVVCKVFEKLLSNSIRNNLDQIECFLHGQHGFSWKVKLFPLLKTVGSN